jgi:DNA repair protein RecO (recombination protein O)
MILYKGKTSYNLSSGELIESFHHLRDDMEKLTYGMFILEFTEFVSYENESNHELMQLVLKVLKVLELSEMDSKLASLVFQLRACTYIGYTPWVTDCISCSELEEPMYFSSKEGGILCSTHLMVDTKAISLNKGVLYTLRYVIGTDMKQLFQFSLDSETMAIFELVIKQFILYNLNKRFKTMEFLEANINNL